MYNMLNVCVVCGWVNGLGAVDAAAGDFPLAQSPPCGFLNNILIYKSAQSSYHHLLMTVGFEFSFIIFKWWIAVVVG